MKCCYLNLSSSLVPNLVAGALQYFISGKKVRCSEVKEGLYIGQSKQMTVEVKEEMVAQFNGEVIHPVYSTASMVYHMEWVSRQLLIPYLEQDEEGMGAAVSVEHIAPSGVGTTIHLEATVIEVSKRELLTKVYVTNEHGRIGKGKVKQVVLPKEVIQEKVRIATK